MPTIRNLFAHHLHIGSYVLPPNWTTDIPQDEWLAFIAQDTAGIARYLEVVVRDPVSR